MRSYQITAIRAWPDETDRLIDSLFIDGTLWPIEKVIEGMRRGPYSFYIEAEGCRAAVIAARHSTSGRWFLTTAGEGFPPKALLALRHVR